MGISYKTCSVCKESKDRGLYHLRSSAKDGLQNVCKLCRAVNARSPEAKVYSKIAMAKYRQTEQGKNAQRKASKRYKSSSGHCTYIATFPEGLYVGSGLTVAREQLHMSGHSDIAKKLNSLAISFDIVYTGKGEACLAEEDRLIREIGLDNLLNTIHVLAVKEVI